MSKLSQLVDRAVDEMELPDCLVQQCLQDLAVYGNMSYARVKYEVARVADNSFCNNEFTDRVLEKGY